MTKSFDGVVVGGGAIGCAVAWKLAQCGLRVVVVERNVPGRGATWAAGGMLSPLGETAHHAAYHRFALASMDRWAAFANALRERSGVDVEYNPAGKLHVAFDEAQVARLESLVMRGAGFGVQPLSGDEARRLEPALSTTVLAAFLVGRDHRVNNRLVADAAWKAAEADGVEFRLGLAVRALETTKAGPARFQAVVLENGERLEAGAAVIACGAWSGEIEGLPRPLPIRPVRGQMFAVESAGAAGSGRFSLLERVVEAPGCYLIPRDSGRVLVGSTAESVGFEPGPTPAGLGSLIEPAIRVVPALANLPIAESWAGYRPGTPDGLPILGPDPGVSGVWYATGHFRNGVLLAPITADAIAAAFVGESLPADLEAFRPDRFEDAS